MKRVLSTGDITDVGLDTNRNGDTCTQVRGQRKKSKKTTAKSQPVQRTEHGDDWRQ